MPVTRQIVWNKTKECVPEVRSEWYDFQKISSEVIVQMRDGSVMMAQYVTYVDEPQTRWRTAGSEGWYIDEPEYWAYVIKP